MKERKSDNILIIGGAGYIGSVLVEEMIRNWNNVIVLDSLRGGGEGILQYKKYSRFTFLNTDFMDGLLPIILESYDIDIVLHLAAIVGDLACA